MSEKTSILVVDDDDFMHEMYAEALGGNYSIIPAEIGVDSLMIAEKERPGLVILDVEMPGMDGYEICRHLKKMDAMAGVPVIFVSAHDAIEDRLKGYEAGGEDYIIKPFNPQELEAKVTQLLRIVTERTSLKQEINYATSTAMTAMTSMSEMGALLESLKKFNACSDLNDLAEAALASLALYGLQGAVQIRSPNETLTRNSQGAASPLEVSIIKHMASMERIAQFKSRLCITYPSVSLLVHDMPLEDDDRCGRLRDHLAMLVDGMEVRVQRSKAESESEQRGEAIEHAVARLTEALKMIDSAQRQRNVDIRVAASALIDKIEISLVRAALTESQDKFVTEIVTGIIKSSMDEIIDAHFNEIDIQNKFTSIVNELKSILAAS